MAADEAPAAVSGPPAAVDPQDPLPEGKWLWRRTFVFGASFLIFVFTWWYAGALGNVALSTDPHTPRQAILDAIDGLVGTIRMDQYIFALLVLLYMAGASTEQITRLVQSASVLKGGFLSRSTAAGPDGSTATTGIAAGPAANPAPPGAPLGPPLSPVGAPLGPPPAPAVEVDAAPSARK